MSVLVSVVLRFRYEGIICKAYPEGSQHVVFHTRARRCLDFATHIVPLFRGKFGLAHLLDNCSFRVQCHDL